MATVAKRWPHQDDYDDIIRDVAGARGVPVSLVKAVIARESEFNPRAYRAEPQIGDASRGLMQLLYRTAQGLGYTGSAEGLYDPRTSIELGVRYLADNISFARANGYGVDSALSAYNGGFSAKRRGDGKRTGDTTATPFINQAYVDWVLSTQRYFDSYSPSSTPGGAGGAMLASFDPFSPTNLLLLAGLGLYALGKVLR